MFKKIRIIAMSVLIIMTLLIITITPVLASTSTMTPHTIGPGATTRYWSGTDGCNNQTPYGIGIFQTFVSYTSIYSGYYYNSTYYRQFSSTNTSGVFWTKADGPAGLFKFYLTNRSTSTIECSSGTIAWSMDY